MRHDCRSLSHVRSFSGFTLVELLAVVAIIAILAALLFPVFNASKESAKKTSCLDHHHQLGVATILYLADYDGGYPQTKPSSSRPEIDDRAGNLEEPDTGPFWPKVSAYFGQTNNLLQCPQDPDPTGRTCTDENPDAPNVTSVLVNASFVFGRRDSDVQRPTQTILTAERRSEGPYCDYLYRPWYSGQNPEAREDEMDAQIGAISTERHAGKANYGFADGHVRTMVFAQTYDPSVGLNLHRP
jgi:prepilin-type processing-associated H-X9-DG protein/prepilin-type N-terminal cleavage/methylation domain-containing protein